MKFYTQVDQELMFQQREAIIFEIFEGEKRYLDTLSTILNAYVLPLRKSLKTTSFGFLGLKKAPCTEKEISWLFNNLDEIYQLHFDNLTVLSERYDKCFLLLLLYINIYIYGIYVVSCNS